MGDLARDLFGFDVLAIFTDRDLYRIYPFYGQSTPQETQKQEKNDELYIFQGLGLNNWGKFNKNR